jgi:hypothetical protein
MKMCTKLCDQVQASEPQLLLHVALRTLDRRGCVYSGAVDRTYGQFLGRGSNIINTRTLPSKTVVS